MSAKINAKLAVLLGLSLLLMPFANALTVNDFFQNFYGLVENQYAFYTIMFLVTFIFLFSIFFALSKNIPFFKGSGGSVGPAGQIFALSLSAIATLSLFSYVQGRGGAGYVSGFFTNRVGSWGPWGWILLALLILAVVFFALRKHGKGILGEGDFDANLKKLTALLWVLSFILVMYGSISKNRTITTIGAVLFVIALILTVLTGGFKFGEKEKEPEPPHLPPVPPEPPEGYGTIYGVVSDKATKQEIPHVRIECAGYVVIADPQGNYAVTVPVGQHALTATKQSYNDYRSNPIQVASKARIEHNIEMESRSAEKGTIEGNVFYKSLIERGIRIGVAGAMVSLAKVIDGQPVPLRNIAPVLSDDSGTGKFKFENLDLPMENIIVYAEKENVGQWHTKPSYLITINHNNKDQKEVVIPLDIPVPPTQMGYIEGKVVYKDERGNEIGVVKDAIVHLYDWNTKRLFSNINPKNSDENGKFKFENLPLPMMQIAVYVEKEGSGNVHWRNGRPSGPINLTITPDHKKEEDVLVALNAPRIQTGKINGTIIDFNTRQPIRSTAGLFYGPTPTDIDLTRAKDMKFAPDGKFEFDNVQFGYYIVQGIAEGYDGKHTDPGGHPSDPIKIDANTPPVEGVIVPLKPIGSPPTPRGGAIFELIVGDRTLPEGQTVESTDLINRNNSYFRIRNSGSGGTLIWYASASKGLRISKAKGILKKEQEDKIEVNVMDRELTFIPHVTIFATFGREKERIEDVIRQMKAKARIYYRVISTITQQPSLAIHTETEMREEAEEQTKIQALEKKVKALRWVKYQRPGKSLVELLKDKTASENLIELGTNLGLTKDNIKLLKKLKEKIRR